MKVASISVIGQHYKGIGMHVRNLRWALEGLDYKIYLFVLKNGNIDYSDCDGLTIIERSNENVLKSGYDFWIKEIPDCIKSLQEDVLVFTQQDMFYKKKLKSLVNLDKIVVNKEGYNCSITVSDKEVYPRIWEGGLIINKELVIDALNKGITLSKVVKSDYVVTEARKCNLNQIFFKKRIDCLEVGDQLDLLGEFCVYCYLSKVPFVKKDILTHFNSLDMIVKKYPFCYGEELTEEFLKVLKKNPNAENPVMMYYISGKYKINDLLVDFMRNLPKGNFFRLLELNSHCHKWMTDEEYDRFCFLKSFRSNKVLKFL